MDDLKSTVFLPSTDFPLKAGLSAQEPAWLQLWADLDLYRRLQRERADAPTFVLHDGPPYANGDIHIGHACNKILKDATVRTRSMLGFRTPYIPGWDCHGLPIEWKVEEKYRKAGKNKDEVPLLDFRGECRAFAQGWVDRQSQEFQRLGVIGDWADPYLTMTFAAEAAIVAELHKFAMNGGLYRGAKPVMWSPVEQTALAEAEVEYHDHSSPTLMVAFPIVSAANPELVGAKIVIWTTTPWTLPANRAIAYGAHIQYAIYRVKAVAEGAHAAVGDTLIVAVERARDFLDKAGITDADRIPLNEDELHGIIAAHPLRGQGQETNYDHDVPLLPGDFVTTEAGTGFVHIAPAHGMDDYLLGLKHGLPVEELVLPDGRYADSVPMFAGAAILTAEGKSGPANKLVTEAIRATGNLVAEQRITHSYPHSWRSKAPVIFRATPQWFISMATNGLRAKALAAIGDTHWFPAAGETRIRSMVADRPDWNISRQRAWGVPLGIFFHKETGDLLRDDAVNARIKDAFQARGADAWYDTPAQTFLGDTYRADDYEQVFDILDVWFESGCTHVFTLEARGLPTPADVYFEGSDQHRGWFQSSLLESCGTRGRAPYKQVVTHGFINDEQGRKMSKSVGNVLAPDKIIDQYGADILRLWVLTSDYAVDTKIGMDIVKQSADAYRRLRNTLRYLLGALAGWDESERVAVEAMPELERYILHKLSVLDETLRAAILRYDYTDLTAQLFAFCNAELSSFFFDIRKDSLYCDAATDPKRRAYRTVLAELYAFLTAWLAPVLCFTAEEAWQQGRSLGLGASDAIPSVHLRTYPDLPAAWRDDALDKKWEEIRKQRKEITGTLEQMRADKVIGSSLEAVVSVPVSASLTDVDWAEVCITSQYQPAHSVTVVEKAPGAKCARCWRVLVEVENNADQLCLRCESVVHAA